VDNSLFPTAVEAFGLATAGTSALLAGARTSTRYFPPVNLGSPAGIKTAPLESV